ncbi:hypothetical protein KNN17_10775, partial [Arthrobacter bambusae]|uniref:hypothetical protein n=1 Tax=Arthrobacter bambusae TaxID=1338426 RepID=UPI001F50CDC5
CPTTTENPCYSTKDNTPDSPREPTDPTHTSLKNPSRKDKDMVIAWAKKIRRSADAPRPDLLCKDMEKGSMNRRLRGQILRFSKSKTPGDSIRSFLKLHREIRQNGS